MTRRPPKFDDADQTSELLPGSDPRKQLSIYRSGFRDGFVAPAPWGPVPDELWEDITQEVLAKAAEALPRYDNTRPMAPWLYTITQRTARDVREREQFREGFSTQKDVGSTSAARGNPEDDMATAQYARLVNETLAEMEKDLREVIEAIELAELTYEETGVLLGISKRKVKERIERAREDFLRRIKKKMGDHGLVVLPFAFEGLFAFIRASTERVSEEELAKLRAIVEQAPAPDERAVETNGSPDGATPAKDVGSTIGSGITGGIVGGAIVYLLMRPAAVPEAVTARIHASSWPIVATESAMVANPAPTTSASAAVPSSSGDVARGARALLDRALLALDEGDIAEARSALARYEERFPGNPLARTRETIMAQIGLAEKNRRGP